MVGCPLEDRYLSVTVGKWSARIIFFFSSRRGHTSLSRDWSSDVCSSDLYAVVAGSFTRYSWPATVAVVGLGTVVVLIGWHGPLRYRQARDRLPVAGTA